MEGHRGGFEAASSPRPWGCFSFPPPWPAASCVFPTPVGVFPPLQRRPGGLGSLPHARGGVSVGGAEVHNHLPSSPRPWGCFHSQNLAHGAAMVFPTPVGVFPSPRRLMTSQTGLPHARGGVSDRSQPKSRKVASSPRPWGCFWRSHHTTTGQLVFPTPVGVFPKLRELAARLVGLPHARGGVSPKKPRPPGPWASSPRPWGCFRLRPHWRRGLPVFPTPVGVFPAGPRLRPGGLGLPHARGGVSVRKLIQREVEESSPRPWGCFPYRCSGCAERGVFPTPVGVFPLCSGLNGFCWCLPHARGGVSTLRAIQTRTASSSPRPWGCFSLLDGSPVVVIVFPTPVGVFLPLTFPSWRASSLPHARGGVSAMYAMRASGGTSSPRPWGCFPAGEALGNPPAVFPTPVGVFPK